MIKIKGAAVVLSLLLTPSVSHGFGSQPVTPTPVEPTPTPVEPKPPVVTPPVVTPPVVTPTPTPTPTMPAPTPGSEFTSCYNRLNTGAWTFGTAPAGCNISPAQNTAYAKAQYDKLIYKDGISNARNEYMSELFPMAKAMGEYYIRRRNPSVTQAEVNGFVAGFQALLNQETFWTHYRIAADGVLRYMRGDSLHGYGIMQVDDRSHAVALNQGKGVDLAENMAYGLDIYYAAWVKAKTASCVTSATDYEQRARAAWSAYNGGSGSICRWTNPNSAHAAKDTQYITKFRAKAWLTHVADQNRQSAVNVSCLVEGVRPCKNNR